MPQTSLWQTSQTSSNYAEVCNALYERELNNLVNADLSNINAMQNRLKSLPHYITRTAYLMTQAQTPLMLDSQNAHWSANQSKTMYLKGQKVDAVWQWYQSFNIPLGLVVPVWIHERILLDSIDRIDDINKRIRTNAFGWFEQNTIQKTLFQNENALTNQQVQLLKPTKKIMMSACAGHRWKNKMPSQPLLLSLRELLLSCDINWQNFKKTPSLC